MKLQKFFKMEKKILYLILKKKWFDKIASGEKLEEYRQFKEYWYTRLINRENLRAMKKAHLAFILLMGKHSDNPKEFWENAKNTYEGCFKEFDEIEFRNGYSKDCRKMRVELKGIELSQGKVEWGAEDGAYYFVLKLGRLITVDV